MTMAHKAKSFKLVEKKDKATGVVVKRNIVIYTNVNEPVEKTLIDFYLQQGYTPMFEEKKPTMSVEAMKADLKNDKEALKKFEEAYGNKDFFAACKVHSSWKKEQKKKKQEKQEADK